LTPDTRQREIRQLLLRTFRGDISRLLYQFLQVGFTSMPEPQTKSKPARDPQALTSEYHKARKQVLLWAGILFIWELVGIDLEKAKDAGGNAGAIITSIKSPQAVPWVLVILVVYFLFKTTIEWYQCNPMRRASRVSRVDFLSAWAIPLLAFALGIYQAIRNVQFADRIFLPNGGIEQLSVLFLAGSYLTSQLFRELLRKPSKNRRTHWINISTGGFGLLSIIGGSLLLAMGRLSFIVSSGLSLVLAGITVWTVCRTAFTQGQPKPDAAQGVSKA
jgi:hypothetical protein